MSIPLTLCCFTPSGSFKSSALSPKRSISNSRHLYARPTTSLCLNYGKTLTTSFLSRKFPHPLNNIYHEKSTRYGPSLVLVSPFYLRLVITLAICVSCHRLASSMHNAALPDGAESILEDSRFESIAAFSRRVGPPMIVILRLVSQYNYDCIVLLYIPLTV